MCDHICWKATDISVNPLWHSDTYAPRNTGWLLFLYMYIYIYIMAWRKPSIKSRIWLPLGCPMLVTRKIWSFDSFSCLSHQSPADSPHKRPVMQTAFPCHGIIMEWWVNHKNPFVVSPHLNPTIRIAIEKIMSSLKNSWQPLMLADKIDISHDNLINYFKSNGNSRINIYESIRMLLPMYVIVVLMIRWVTQISWWEIL